MMISERNRKRFFLITPLLILIIVCFIFIGLFLVLSRQYINVLYERYEKQYTQSLINIVSVARHSVEPVLKKLRSDEITRREAIDSIRTILRAMVYEDQDGENYIFMSSYKGIMLVQPFEPEKELTNQWDLKDVNGLYIIRALVQAAKLHPEGSFVSYYYYLPSIHAVQQKLAYVVGIPEIECYIGTGIYMQRNIQSQKDLMTKIRILFILVLIAILIPAAISISVVLNRNRRLLNEIIIRRKTEENLSKSEEKSRQSEEKFMKIFMTVPFGIIISSLEDGLAIEVNKSCEDILGWKYDEMIGYRSDDPGYNFWVDPAQRNYMVSELESGREVINRNFNFRGKDGNPRPGIYSARSISIYGKPYVIFILQDISEQKRLEEDSRKLKQQLAQSQKLDAIGTLAGGIAHDFNNILSGILGYTELSMMDLKNEVKVREYLEQVLSSAGRARELVNQILTFSRQSETVLKPISPKYVIKEALKLLRASIPSTIELHTKIESESAILGDPTQLHQVIVNMCANAAYAMKDGKGVIEVRLEDLDVDEEFIKLHSGLKPGKHILLRISDTGRGIEPDLLDRIFEPFFTTKPRGEGTGLGLSVVHGIVNKFNGIINVYSETGKGTTFNIILPVIETENTPDIIMYKDELPRGRERILLVDDEPAIVDSMYKILETLGYNVFVASDSTKALLNFQKEPDKFDLVITDYTMPNLTGIDIAYKIKEIRPDIPVIMCSGYMLGGVEEEARKAGISKLMKKPVSTLELAVTVRNIIDGK